MRVNLLIHKLAARNGLQRLFLNLANELAKLGNEVSISAYIYNENVVPENISQNLRINAINRFEGKKMVPPSILSSFYQGKEYFISSRKWAESIDVKNFDVINAYEEIAHKAAINLKKKNSCPIVWCLADPPVYADKGARISLYQSDIRYRLMMDVFSLFDKRVVRKLDEVIVLDNRVKNIVDNYYNIDARVVRIAGVDTDLFSPNNAGIQTRLSLEKEVGIPANAVLILSVSIFMWYRRFEDVIAAVSSLNKNNHNIHYLIVGNSAVSPQYYHFLQNYVRSIHAEDFIHFVSRSVTDSELIDLYNACDIFIFPNDNQTWGLAPLEAMSVGKPVIVTTGAGVHEVLEDGRTALIAQKRNPDSIASKIKLLLEDKALYVRLARNGQQFVRQNLTLKKCAERLEDSLKVLLAK